VLSKVDQPAAAASAPSESGTPEKSSLDGSADAVSPSPDLARSSPLSRRVAHALAIVLLLVWLAVLTPLALWHRLRGRQAFRKCPVRRATHPATVRAGQRRTYSKQS